MSSIYPSLTTSAFSAPSTAPLTPQAQAQAQVDQLLVQAELVQLQHAQFEQELAAQQAQFQSALDATSPNSTNGSSSSQNPFQDSIANLLSASPNSSSSSSSQLYQEAQLVELMAEIAALESQNSSQTAANTGTSTQPAMQASSATGNNYNMMAGANTFDVKSTGAGSIGVNVDGQKSHVTLQQSKGSLVNLDESVAGGYNVATGTKKDANGVTHNSSAGVQLNSGDSIMETFDAKGKQTVQYQDASGTHTLSAGQTHKFNQNESATLNSDGTLTIKANGYNGAAVQTQITNNGQGLDVDTSGTNAYVGGYAGQQASDHQQQMLQQTA